LSLLKQNEFIIVSVMAIGLGAFAIYMWFRALSPAARAKRAEERSQLVRQIDALSAEHQMLLASISAAEPHFQANQKKRHAATA
jgi:hypothetical protein